MLKISYSSLVYYWHLVFLCIYDSNPLECFPPMKCCLTGRGTNFGKALCNISASDPILMISIQQKAIDCLKSCLEDPECQTYEYNSDNCGLGFRIYQDCFSYLVNKFSDLRLLYQTFMHNNKLRFFLNFSLISLARSILNSFVRLFIGCSFVIFVCLFVCLSCSYVCLFVRLIICASFCAFVY